jgi:hypothetical protein
MSYILLKDFIGKDRGLKFDQGAHIEIALKIGTSRNAAFAGYAIIWGGLVACVYRKGEEIDFTFEQVCDAADKLTPEQINEIGKCYLSTVNFEREEVKKKTESKQPPKSTKQKASK